MDTNTMDTMDSVELSRMTQDLVLYLHTENGLVCLRMYRHSSARSTHIYNVVTSKKSSSRHARHGAILYMVRMKHETVQNCKINL